jgi:hypothetical protein
MLPLVRFFMSHVWSIFSLVHFLLGLPVYSNIPGHPLEYASTILGCIGVLVVIPIYVFYWKGPEIRARSKFAMTLESDRKKRGVTRVDTLGEKAQADHIEETGRV